MSWKPEVQVSGNGPAWCSNALRFTTQQEAEENARDLMMRWLAVMNIRAAECDEPVNYKWMGRVQTC